MSIEGHIREYRTNAAIGWVVVSLLVVASAVSLLTGTPLWAIFPAAVALVGALPAVGYRSPLVMPPWEVLAVAALPVLGRLFATTLVTGQLATYLSVAALALLVAVDLTAFTAVRMSDGFALLFVVLTTMAAAGVWAVLRYLADVALGTGFIESEHALMVEFVASTAAGVLAGALYVLYVRRRAAPGRRLPPEVEVP